MRPLATASLLFAILGASSIPSAHAASSKLDPLARRALALVRAGTSLETLSQKGVAVGPARELEVFVSGDVTRAELEAAGARVRTALPGLFTASIPAAAIDRVAALSGVRRIRGAGRVTPNLNLSVPSTGAPNLRGAAPDFTGLNGAGVIVGDVDSGVDYDHGDFKNPNGTTRLVNIWDQTTSDAPAPAGFGYGSEWDAASIDAQTSTEVDVSGHGTHVLGIAGGDGSQTGGVIPAFTYVGMAPRADLMMVKTNFLDVGVVDGVDYIMGRATALGQNAVVNLSLGTLFGPKDGTSEFEVAITALTGPGKIVVVSAGNAGNTPVHAEFVGPGANGTVTMNVSSTPAGGFAAIDGYYPGAATPSVRITTPQGTAIGPVAVGAANAVYPGTLTGAGFVYLENGVSTTTSGDKQVYFEVNVPDPAGGANANGTWTLQFITPGAGAGHDETTEDHTGSQWGAAAAATPGTVAGAVTGDHLLITEIGWRGINTAMVTDSTEFVEIYNPTASAIDLTNVYLADVNAYQELPVAGTVNLASINTDFAMKFPDGASIPAGGVRVIAADGGRYRRGTGVDADFMFANGGGTTTAQLMVDKGQHSGAYPAFGIFTNGGEFLWLFQWDGLSDLVCDVDFVYWGSATGGNLPTLKGSVCQDGPDAGTGTTCYALDNGNPAGSLGRPLATPAAGTGTRQRTGAEGAESGSGNGCSDGGGGGGLAGVDPDAEVDLWIFAASGTAVFVLGADPTTELIGAPGTALDVITVGAWTGKTSWVDCGGRNVSYVGAPPLGEIADFSSQGPTRDGRQKPDITASGFGVGSALTRDVSIVCPAFPTDLLNDGPEHWVNAGTSMAAPHVSGAVALLLQKYGAMTPAQVNAILIARATTDAFTGAVWNNEWGFGKLNLGDLTDPITQVTSPNGGEMLEIGTSVPLTWTASDAYQGVTAVDLELSRDGGSSWETIATNQPNSGSYNWMVTGPATANARFKAIAKDAAQNAGRDSSDADFAISAPIGVSSAAITDYELGFVGGQPARGPVAIEFAVPRPSDVRVDVFDVAGRKVGALAGGPHAQGRYRVRFDGAAQGQAGLFFVRMTVPGRTIMRRLVMLR